MSNNAIQDFIDLLTGKNNSQPNPNQKMPSMYDQAMQAKGYTPTQVSGTTGAQDIKNKAVSTVKNIVNTPLGYTDASHTTPITAKDLVEQVLPNSKDSTMDKINKTVGLLPMLMGGMEYVNEDPEAAAASAEKEPATASKPMPTIKSTQPNVFKKMANAIDSDINKAAPQDIATNPRAQQEIGTLQDSLRRHNVYNAQQAGPAMDKIYKEIINPYMEKNSVQVPLDGENGIVPKIVTEMRKMEPGLSEREAKNAASKWINNLYDVSRNSNGEEGVVPESIDSKSLLDMKTNLNGTRALKRYFTDGTINSTDDLAAVASRNALSKILNDVHPEISQYVRDYGNIAEAYPSLYQASQQSSRLSGNPVVAVGQLGKPAVANTLRTVGNIADTKAGKVALGAATVGGAYALGKAGSPQSQSVQQGDNQQGQDLNSNNGNGQSNVQTNGSTSKSDHNYGIPQTPDDIKPDANGKYNVVNPYSIPGSDGTPMFLSDSQYAQQRAAIQNRLNDPSVKFNPVESQKVQSDLNNLDAKYASSKDVSDAYQATSKLNNEFDQVEETLKGTSPNVFTGINLPIVGAPIEQLREATDPKYSQLVQQVRQLEKDAGLPQGSLYKPGQTPDVLRGNLETARKNTLNKFYTGLNGVIGNSATPAPAQAATPTYSPGSSMPPVGAPSGMAANQNLPPINPQFQVK